MSEHLSSAEAGLRAGRFDPTALLVVWCVRKAFYGVLWLGLAIAALTDHLDEVSSDVNTLLPDLRSPLSIVWLALALRLGAAGAGYALAYPLARQQQSSYTYRSGILRYVDLALDRWQLTRSLSSLRWTYPVRALAVARLGRTGKALSHAATAINVLDNLLLVALIGVLIAGA